ncbi:MAG: hypothetical protein CFE21_00765 [Bacteroidetes bacterium B1(2017)]|nr:MAG: hypothetical protein CFE21_00765 [Bacteroidetes bacterium B1(2017)]
MTSALKHLFRSCSLLITLFFVLFSNTINASHIVGSDMRYICSGTPGVYNVEFKLYRDCQGIQLCANCPGSLSPSCAITINIAGASSPAGSGMPTSPCAGTSFGTANLTVVNSASGFDVVQLCKTEKTICSNCGTRTAGTFTPGIEVYTFTGQVNLSALPASCCLVSLNYSSCCRNAAITTLVSPTAQNYYSEAIINRCATPCNSAPTFSNAPVIVACAGQDFNYNLGAMDPDGDSLSYSFGEAMGGPNSPLPYVSPYSATVPFPYLGAPLQSPPAIPPVGISLDPVTGDLRVRPTGTFVAMLIIEVKQWKTIGGIPTIMGITRRDIQFYTLYCPNNNPPVIRTYTENATLTSPQPNFSYAICAGQQICFMIGAWDNGASTDSTDITWNAPKNLVDNGATFTKCYNPATRGTEGPKQDSVRFCWTPPASMASNLPYYFVVKASDRACPIPGSVTRSFSVLVRKVPQAWINKTNKYCGNYDFSYSLQNTVPIDNSYTKFLVETAPHSGTYLTYNASAVSNHHFDTSGWYRIQLNLTTVSPPTPNGCPNNSILDSVLVAQPVSVSIRDTFNCTSNPVYVQAKGSWGTPYGLSYRYTFYSGDSNSTTTIRSFGVDSNCLISPATSGSSASYKVVIRDLNGCQDSAMFKVYTKQSFTGSLMPLSATTFCSGDSVKLQASIDSSYTYIWFKNNELIPNQNSNYLIAKNSGVYKVAISDSSGCIVTTSSVIVTVNPLPIASITPADSASICVGSSQLLTANNGVNLSYEWYLNDTLIAGQIVRTLTATAAGNYKVKTINLRGCSAFSSPLHLFVNSNPIAGSITGPTTGLSTATSYTYSVASQVGLSYYWLISNGTITSGQGTNSISVQWTNPGTCMLLVGVKNSNNCADSATLLTSIGTPTPAILYFVPDSARTNDIVNIFGSNLTGASSVKLGGVNVLSYTVVSSNQISVVVGTGASGIVEVETPLGTAQKVGFTYLSSTGIGNISNLPGLSVYPNPVHNELVICCLENGTLPTNVSITDMLGRVVAEPSKNLNGNSIELSTQNLAPGTYIICIQKGNDLSRMKFVKE